MKTLLRLTLVASVIIFLSSCTRSRYDDGYYNPVVGSWVLTDAAQGGYYGWQSIYTGLENGVFNFYSSGTITYRDARNSMRGDWYMRRVSGGYYDEFGNYYNDIHDELELHLVDSYTGATMDLYFNDVGFTNNRMVTTYHNNNYVVRYRFARY
ncbi:MAG: hypothetical protein J0I41_17415 [Filimonas sp.]|nr:hypothetical protein [Filimonas sp.]